MNATLDKRTLTHLRQLEAESIQILREAASEFEKPEMMYSIGKDSAGWLAALDARAPKLAGQPIGQPPSELTAP